MNDDLPAEFEEVYYRQTYADLAGMTDAGLRAHYEKHGRGEGRSSSPAGRRSNFDAAAGAYIDVHAWQFTPSSFRLIMQSLFDLGLTQLRPERVYDTPRGTFEFTAVLQKA